jgi:hypothetical protein
VDHLFLGHINTSVRCGVFPVLTHQCVSEHTVSIIRRNAGNSCRFEKI